METGVEIPLLNRTGLVVGHAVVSARDSERVLTRRWHLRSDGYAGSRHGCEGSRTLLLHRFVLGLGFDDPRQGDHKNRNRLDNRRSNLRVATRAEQQQNLPSMGGRSRFRGVAWDTQTGKWRAVVVFNGKQHSCGRHANELDAARAAETFRLANMPFALPTSELEIL